MERQGDKVIEDCRLWIAEWRQGHRNLNIEEEGNYITVLDGVVLALQP